MIDLERLWYEIRWLWWFVRSPGPVYLRGSIRKPPQLQAQAHRILIERWQAKEPDFHGRYPNRRSQDL